MILSCDAQILTFLSETSDTDNINKLPYVSFRKTSRFSAPLPGKLPRPVQACKVRAKVSISIEYQMIADLKM